MPKLSDEMALKLKQNEAATKYMKEQRVKGIRILVKSSLYGDLEYKYLLETK